MSSDSQSATEQITASAHVLAVADLDRSRSFYERVLGFEDMNVAAPGWCFMQRDACRLQIGECPDAPPAGETGDHSYFAYIYVRDAAALYDNAQQQGAEVIKPLQDEPWGMKEFALRTPDGHRIMIGEPSGD